MQIWFIGKLQVIYHYQDLVLVLSSEGVGGTYYFAGNFQAFYSFNKRLVKGSCYFHIWVFCKSSLKYLQTENGILRGKIEKITSLFTGNFEKIMGFSVISRLYQGSSGQKWRHYTCFLHLDLISISFAQYIGVISRTQPQFLPFKGILHAISRPLNQNSTQKVPLTFHSTQYPTRCSFP